MGERRGDPGFDIGRGVEPDPADADGFDHGGEIRVLERAVVEHDRLHRQAELRETAEVAHQPSGRQQCVSWHPAQERNAVVHGRPPRSISSQASHRKIERERVMPVPPAGPSKVR
jgi:hypothetical protein